MRILFFNWRDITHPMAGGAEVYLHEIAKRLASEHDVTLFCPKYPGSNGTDEIDGIRLMRRGGSFSLYIHAALHCLLGIRRGKYDIVVDSINGVPFFTPLFARKPRVAILHHLGDRTLFFKELPFPPALVAWLAQRSIPLVYRRTPMVTVSDSSRQELVEYGMPADRINIVYNAIEQAMLGPGAKSPTPVIAYVGRIKQSKQIDHLLKAFEMARSDVPQAQVVVAGRGDYDNLHELLDGSPIKSCVSLRGEVSEQEKADILRKAWVFVIPSTKEGWGISVIEANGCGTPAIGYDVPGLRESIRHGETGLLVPSGDIRALAEAIVRLLTDTDLRDRMSQNALQWSSGFSWDRSAREFNAILKKVAGA